MLLESLVGAVNQLFAIHFSPLVTSHPPCSECRSKLPRRPLSWSMKLLYHMMAVPFLAGKTRFAPWQFVLRLNLSSFKCSSSYHEEEKRVIMHYCGCQVFSVNILYIKCKLRKTKTWESVLIPNTDNFEQEVNVFDWNANRQTGECVYKHPAVH